jgi:hypothetical protein
MHYLKMEALSQEDVANPSNEASIQNNSSSATCISNEMTDSPSKQATHDANHNDSDNNNNGKKRKRERVDHYANAYENTHYEPISSQPQEIHIPGVPDVIQVSNPPGTPLRQFAHSFQASLTTNNEIPDPNHQIIHQHANGLAIVTAGSLCSKFAAQDVLAIDFLVAAADPCSAGARRKRQSKMLKKGKANNASNKKNNNMAGDNDTATWDAGVVTPSTQIARITLHNGKVIPIHALVWGAILEVHTHVTPEQLTQDPLIEGYLAIVLPTGPFPPSSAKCGDCKQKNDRIRTSLLHTDEQNQTDCDENISFSNVTSD